MSNELKFNSENYWDVIKGSGLTKAERNLLVEIFTSYFECGTAPTITEDNFNRFTKGLPTILANGVKVSFVYRNNKIQVDGEGLKQSTPFEFCRRRKSKILGISSKRRRKRS